MVMEEANGGHGVGGDLRTGLDVVPDETTPPFAHLRLPVYTGNVAQVPYEGSGAP